MIERKDRFNDLLRALTADGNSVDADTVEVDRYAVVDRNETRMGDLVTVTTFEDHEEAVDHALDQNRLGLNVLLLLDLDTGERFVPEFVRTVTWKLVEA